jgi:cytochrome c5
LRIASSPDFQRKKMAEHHHHADPIEENIDTHPVKLAIGVLIGAAALIVGIILLAELAISSYGSRPAGEDVNMRPDRVAARIGPDASVAIDPNAPVAPPAAPANVAAVTPVAVPPPAAATPGAAAADAGKKTFDAVCTACHTAGVAGAPKFGDKAAWAPRIKTGKDALYNAALHGLNAMPAKGGNPSLPDSDVKAAVDYMVAAAK